MRPEHVEPVFAAARAHARDRYLSALLNPGNERDDLVALAAVVGEIERIPALVTEPMMGEIRLQWWADWLDAVQSSGPVDTGNPVADAFGDLIRARGLDTGGLTQLVVARTLDLYADPPADAEAYADYLDETEGEPFRLAAKICEVDPAQPDAGTAIRAAARAYGGVRTLLKLPFFAARGRWPLAMAPDQKDATPLAADERSAAIREASVRQEIQDIAHAARQAGDGISALPPATARCLRRALRPVALVGPYLRHLEAAKAWTLASGVDLSELARVWRLWTAKYLGRP